MTNVTATCRDLIEPVCRYIRDHLDDEPSLADLSEKFHVSQFHLQRTFKQVMGVTPRQFAATQRMECFKSRLRAGETVTEAMFSAGYSSSSRVYGDTLQKLGMTPATYQQGGAGMRITYTICNFALGRILIGMTERGVSAVIMGGDDAELEARLREEYPAAELYRCTMEVNDWVTAIIEHVEGSHPDLDLPLDLQVSAFQLRVYHELLKIPYGETRTYAQIAEAIGQPAAERAVARACATNPTPIAVPCHRVVRADGSPSKAYAGDPAWKAYLHDQEQKHKTEA